MTKNMIDALEQLNKEHIELLNSINYQYGLSLNKWKKRCLTFDLSEMKKSLQAKIKEKKIKKNFYNPELRQQSDFIDESIDLNSIRLVIYTCITGSYDSLKEPLLNFSNVDYILFTDNVKAFKDVVNTQWQIRQISNEEVNTFNNMLTNRHIKLHPHELFSKNYDYSIYIDGNIQVISDPRKLAVLSNSKCGIAMHSHGARRCIYDEAEVCKIVGKGVKSNINHQIYKYQEEGFPKEFGLMEANVISVQLSNCVSEKILNDWWKEFLITESFRDQLSFPYIVWKNGKKMEDINCLGPNVYENVILRGHEHR